MRRRSAETERWWREQIRLQADSGLTARAWCDREQIAKSAFYRWRYRLAQEKQTGPEHIEPRPVFMPVRVVGLDSSTDASSGVELICASGMRVVVSRDFDEQTLRRVVEVMRSC